MSPVYMGSACVLQCVAVYCSVLQCVCLFFNCLLTMWGCVCGEGGGRGMDCFKKKLRHPPSLPPPLSPPPLSLSVQSPQGSKRQATCVCGMGTECCRVLQCVAECCRVLQSVAVCCSVLQCVAACSAGTKRYTQASALACMAYRLRLCI